MPRGDRTGPTGSGPGTGRGAGYCAGHPVPGFMNPLGRYGFGQGFGGRGRGRGRGFRHRCWAPGSAGWGYPGYGQPWNLPYAHYDGSAVDPYPSKKDELDMLRDQAEYFEDILAGINERLDELERAKSEKNQSD